MVPKHQEGALGLSAVTLSYENLVMRSQGSGGVGFIVPSSRASFGSVLTQEHNFWSPRPRSAPEDAGEDQDEGWRSERGRSGRMGERGDDLSDEGSGLESLGKRWRKGGRLEIRGNGRGRG